MRGRKAAAEGGCSAPAFLADCCDGIVRQQRRGMMSGWLHDWADGGASVAACNPAAPCSQNQIMRSSSCQEASYQAHRKILKTGVLRCPSHSSRLMSLESMSGLAYVHGRCPLLQNAASWTLSIAAECSDNLQWCVSCILPSVSKPAQVLDTCWPACMLSQHCLIMV